MFFADGTDSFYEDYISTGYGLPIKDNTQNLDAHPDHSVDLKDGVVTVFARRKLDTGDATDYVIPLDTWFNIGYAYHGSSSTLTKHTLANTVAVTLKADGTPLYGQMSSATDVEPTTPNPEAGHDDHDGHDHEDDAAFYALATGGLTSFAATLAILQ